MTSTPRLIGNIDRVQLAYEPGVTRCPIDDEILTEAHAGLYDVARMPDGSWALVHPMIHGMGIFRRGGMFVQQPDPRLIEQANPAYR